MLIANNAAVTPNGLLDIAGGGWEFMAVQSLPAPISGWVAGIMQFDEAELGQSFQVAMKVTDPQKATMTGAVLTIQAVRRLAPFAVPFAAILHGVGTIEIRLEHSSGPCGDVSFEVRAAQPQTPPASS
jgi:hypothetical protein